MGHLKNSQINLNSRTNSFVINRLIKVLVLFFFLLMFLFPSATYQGASSGLLLWFLNVLPTLLPFIILSNLMIRLNIAGRISRFIHPLFGKLFRISLDGSYPILIGFLSGIPMGAKATADLASDNKINRDEGNLLLGMCNNASPIFIFSFIAMNQLKLPHIRIPLFVIVYGSSILSAYICRSIYRFYQKSALTHKVGPVTGKAAAPVNFRSVRFTYDILDSSIMNGFEVITKIGGYIILFSILAQIVYETGPDVSLLKAFFMGTLEITTGISQICKLRMDINIKIVLAAVLTSFGGLSGIAQTKSVLGCSRLSLKYYLIVKLLSALLAFLLSVLYVFVLQPN